MGNLVQELVRYTRVEEIVGDGITGSRTETKPANCSPR